MDQDLRYETLIEKLLKKTKAGELRWEPTASDETFVTSILGKYGLTLELEGGYIHLSLHDEYDRRIFKISPRIGQPGANLVSLFELAREQALKATETVDEILEKL